MSNKDDINENRRRINYLTGAGILTVVGGGLLAAEEGREHFFEDGEGQPEPVETKTPEPQPDYISDVVELTPGEFKNIYDSLDSVYQEDILEGGENGAQYQAWFGEDDYESLEDVSFFYNEDPSKESSILYTHTLGDSETHTREKLENPQTPQVLYNEVMKE